MNVPSSEGEERPGTLTDGGAPAPAPAPAAQSSQEESSGSTGSKIRSRRSCTPDVTSYQVQIQPRASNPSQDGASQSDRWDMHIEDLKKFKAEHGHCNVPRTFWNKYLATFVRRIRLEYAGRKLERSRVKILIDIGFMFDPRGDQWKSKYNELAKFLEEKKEFGEKEPTVTKKENESLIRWIGKQREEHAKLMRNQNSSMNEERIGLLQKIGVNLNPTGKSFDGIGSAGESGEKSTAYDSKEVVTADLPVTVRELQKRGAIARRAGADTRKNGATTAFTGAKKESQAQQLQRKEAVVPEEANIDIDRPAIDDGDPHCEVQQLYQLRRKGAAVPEEANINADRRAIDDGNPQCEVQQLQQLRLLQRKEAVVPEESNINTDRPAIDDDDPQCEVRQLQRKDAVVPEEANINADRRASDDGDPQGQLQRKEAVTKDINIDRPAIDGDNDDNIGIPNRVKKIDPLLLKKMNTLSAALNGEINTGGGKSWAGLTKEAQERVEALREFAKHLSDPDLREGCIRRRGPGKGEQCIDPTIQKRDNALSAVLGCDGNNSDESEDVSDEEAKEREVAHVEFFRLLSNRSLLEERIDWKRPNEGEICIAPDVLEKQRRLSRLIEEGDKAKVVKWIAKNEEKQKKIWEEEHNIARAINAEVPANLPEGLVPHDSERQAPFTEQASGERLPWTRQPWSYPDDNGTPVPTSTYIQRANDLTAGLRRYQEKTDRDGSPTKQKVDELIRLERLAEKGGRTLKRQKIAHEEAVAGEETNRRFHYETDDEFENKTDEEGQVRAREERALQRFLYLRANYDTIVKKSFIWMPPKEGEIFIDPAILDKMELMNGFLFERDGFRLMNEWYQGTADKEGRPTMPPEALEQQRKFDNALVDSLRKWRIHLGINFCPWDQAGTCI